jgi:hypothetical protein
MPATPSACPEQRRHVHHYWLHEGARASCPGRAWPRAPKDDRLALRTLLAHLESLADTRADDDPGKLAEIADLWPGQAASGSFDAGVSRPGTLPVKACGVGREHRQAVAPFLDSWVIAPLQAVLAHLDGAEDYATEAYVRQTADDAR